MKEEIPRKASAKEVFRCSSSSLEIFEYQTGDSGISSAGFHIIPDTISTLSGMYFGGIAVHSDGSIGKTHLIDPSGAFPIIREDVLSPGFGRFYPGGHLQAYQNIATKLSGAAGKIYIDMCRCSGLSAYNTSRVEHQKQCPWLHHPTACMSGFWIEGSRFVTSAHFSKVFSLTEQETKNTEAYLKAYLTSDEPKAIVCSEAKVPKNWKNASRAVPVYLLKLDRKRDLAIFQAYHDGHGQLKLDPANTGLLRSDITTLAQCDKSQSAFTVGYYQDDPPLQTLNAFDSQALHTFWPNDDDTRPTTYFPVKSAAVMQKRNDSLRFEDVFKFPDYRTISAGDIGGVFEIHKLSNFVFSEISTWYQSSGGMVGGFSRHEVDGQLKPVIFGVAHGEQGSKNVIAAFTPEGIDWLFE